MKARGFFTGWVLSSLVMYLLFYVFHGLITNDLLKISIPRTVFLTVAAIVYLLLGLGMSILIDASFFKQHVKNVLIRAVIAGPITGIFLYGVAIVIGISFSAQFTALNLLVDVAWQVVEQTAGFALIAVIKVITFNPNEIEV